jgi:glycosyltransferase involved in cell wall biosynthesis
MDAPPDTILIPAFNEAASIDKVIRKIRELCPRQEILVINDGSTDGTEAAARQAGARVINHPYNMGYGAAIKTGVRHARGAHLVFFDADGQHDPKDIPRLLEALGQSDMAVGARPVGTGAWGRRSGKWFLYRVANYLVGRSIPDLNSGLRAIRRSLALQFIHLLPNGFSLSTTLTLALFRSGYRVSYLPIQVQERVGKSTVSPVDFFKTLFLILRMITLFAPLRIFLPACGLLLLIGIPSLLWDLSQRNITDTTVLIWLMSLLIFLFGLLADTISLVSRKDFRILPDDYTEES